jgi:hypothetical protein
MPREVQRRVAAAFVKSRISESDLAETILALIDGSASLTPAPYLAA